MKHITSRTNPLIKHLVSLQHKKHRLEHGQFIAEGKRICTTLIQNGVQLEHLFVTDNRLSAAQKFAPTDRIVIVPDHVMEKISVSDAYSGIIGQFHIPAHPNPATLSTGIVLAHITDPGNAGTLIRTTAALNFKSVVIIEGVDPWSPKVVQSSAGTLAMLSIFQMSWQELLAHKKLLSLCALVVEGGKKPSELSLENSLFVIGSEAHGIPAEWVAQCDTKLTLPMPGNTESLNAAIAGSIMLYLAYQAQSRGNL
jgi:TrmH family RNA methyltransferase